MESSPSHASHDLGATRELLPLARGGDSDAKGRLFVRYERPLSRFLHARMPAGAHSLVETQDVVQEVFARALESLDALEFRGAGAFWAYLRTVGMRHVYDLQRRAHVRRGEALDLSDSHRAPATVEASPLAHLIGSEQLAVYERALAKLPERTRQALLLRIELDLDYAAIASELDYPSGDAARMAIARALKDLGEEMGRGREA
ncbi:MAG: sigma-70 family RNA polymerase sigma factor [Planctomycetes bacterium]|nr:sigma-70 family RNA polymerase sigma factor [Planctomycetota bacterium]